MLKFKHIVFRGLPGAHGSPFYKWEHPGTEERQVSAQKDWWPRQLSWEEAVLAALRKESRKGPGILSPLSALEGSEKVNFSRTWH